MARYRKKPVEIEAITFGDLVEHGVRSGATLYKGMPWSFEYRGQQITHENDGCYLIPTLEGTMRMESGDMLITGVKGEIYPCKPDIFEATYEPVGSEPEDDLTDQQRVRGLFGPAAGANYVGLADDYRGQHLREVAMRLAIACGMHGEPAPGIVDRAQAILDFLQGGKAE